MANQTIPITLTAAPVEPGSNPQDLNALLQLIASNLAGSIRADVSFILIVLFDPTNYVGDLIFNSQQRVFKAWDNASGRYVVVTSFTVADVKQSYAGVDSVATGWVLLDGREITAVVGLTAQQIAALEVLFGVDGSLPTVGPVGTPGLYSLVFCGYP